MKNHAVFFVYNISYKILTGAKLLCVRFNKVDRFIRGYDGTRFLTLFGLENTVPFTIGLNNIVKK